MIFNSFSFLIFFPIVTIGYFLLPHRFRWVWLLVASCYFYASYIPQYLFILFFLIGVDYIAGIAIAQATGAHRKAWLVASLVANLAMLGTFKYFDFFNGFVAELFAAQHLAYPIHNLNLLLPIGLSFHTFQSMAYTIEVYKGRWQPERHLGRYALYVLFYPQLVAGPIERPAQLLPQFSNAIRFDADRTFAGLRLMLWGFFKKIVIADNLAVFVDRIYNHLSPAVSPLALVLATYCFAFQIYCDFSGYSDIAIGAARVLGIDLVRNFDRPYSAKSVTEFWHRWHISLSTWFRDYLYIPLGGSRVAPGRYVANIMIVFLLSGLWHGANWTFLIWGALHGLYVVASVRSRAWRERIAGSLGLLLRPRLHAIWQNLATFHLVLFAWIFFRANSLADARFIVKQIASGFVDGTFAAAPRMLLRSDVVYSQLGTSRNGFAALAMAVVAMEILQRTDLFHWRVNEWSRSEQWFRGARWATYYTLILGILFFGNLSGHEFIYFKF